VSRKRWIWTGLLAAALLAIAGIGWSLRDDLGFARIATGYAAKQTCSCLHVSGRTLDSCIADFPDEARGPLQVSEPAPGQVRASVLFGAVSAQAVYEEGFGCRILAE
jgi:hypothetical protein